MRNGPRTWINWINWVVRTFKGKDFMAQGCRVAFVETIFIWEERNCRIFKPNASNLSESMKVPPLSKTLTLFSNP